MLDNPLIKMIVCSGRRAGDVEKVKEGDFACKVCPKRDSCSFRREAEVLSQGYY
jgi:hypothetical protein